MLPKRSENEGEKRERRAEEPRRKQATGAADAIRLYLLIERISKLEYVRPGTSLLRYGQNAAGSGILVTHFHIIIRFSVSLYAESRFASFFCLLLVCPVVSFPLW